MAYYWRSNEGGLSTHPKMASKDPRGSIRERYKVAGQLWAFCLFPNPGWASISASSPIEMEPFGRLGRPNFETWAPQIGPFFFVWSSFLVVKKHESLNVRNSQTQTTTPTGSTHHACCLKHVCLGNVFLTQRKLNIAKIHPFFSRGGSSHVDMVSPTTVGTLVNTWTTGVCFRLSKC